MSFTVKSESVMIITKVLDVVAYFYYSVFLFSDVNHANLCVS